jgi:hypothetical protein
VNGIISVILFLACSLLVYKRNSVLYVNFISCYITDNICQMWEILGETLGSFKFRIT